MAVGAPQRLQALTRKDFTLYVDLTAADAEKGVMRNIGVICPAGIDQVTIVPFAARIVRASPPELFKTNEPH